jgi:hypothetical protein
LGETLPASTKKIVTDVVDNLKKIPSPEKKGETFWAYLKEQLYSESPWDKEDLNVIEQEIDKSLDSLDKKDLTELWKNTDKGWEKFEADKKVDDKEMKSDLTDEILGQVMDRMDDHYVSRDSFFPESTVYERSSKEEVPEEKPDEEAEPENLDDEDIKIDDDDLFNDEEFEEDDETHY